MSIAINDDMLHDGKRGDRPCKLHRARKNHTVKVQPFMQIIARVERLADWVTENPLLFQ
jgi:hypothetical protein